MSEVHLFAYGSLMRGFLHHDQLAGASFIAEASTRRGFSLYLFEAYPALVRGGSGVVHGEVFGLSRRHLLELDDFEQAPQVYQRSPVVLAGGLRAFAYVMRQAEVDTRQFVKGGRWTLAWQERTSAAEEGT